MNPREPVAAYLDGVATEATDRPRAIAAALLAEALRRPPEAQPHATLFLEERVASIADQDADTAAEVVYEVGSIMVELRDRFPHLSEILPPSG